MSLDAALSEKNLSEKNLSAKNLSEQDRPGQEPVRRDPAIHDLDSRTAIHDLVVEFYREIVFDEVLEPVFHDVAEVDWPTHIPKLVDYWCRILLGDPGVPQSITAAHRWLHELEPLRPEHCDRWWELWVRSVDAHWRGPVAEHAKSHARTLMAGMARHVFGYEWTPPA